MAQEHDEDSEMSEYSDEESLINDNEEEDYVLRGLRFMTNNLEGLDHEEEDVSIEEDDDDQESSDEEEESQSSVENLPSVAEITEKLQAKGITMDDLVKALLIDHDEFESQSDEINKANGKIFGKIRGIIRGRVRDEPAIAPERRDEEFMPIDLPIAVMTFI
jgi:hypothetical protein